MQNQKGKMNIVVSFIIVALVVSFVVYAFMHKTTEAPIINTEQNPVVTTKTEDVTQTQVKETVNNLKNKNMEKISKNGDVLVMNYTGKLVDGTVFDSNVDPKFNHVQPFQFILGAGQVIKGWDEGLVGMKVGEKKTLTISPEKGYGAQAVGPIPANSTLIFDVELVAIK